MPMTQKQIDALNIQVGDYVRCEWIYDSYVEGTVTSTDIHGWIEIAGEDRKVNGSGCGFDVREPGNKKSIQVLRRAMEKDVVCKENLVAGETVIADGDGYEALVLEVGETSFLRSYTDPHDAALEWLTYKKAQREGWKIKLPSSDTVEFNGKKYKKEEVEERLKELKSVE